jgi:hypothetical protein
MGDNLQEEVAILTAMNQLASGWSAQWKATKYEGARVISDYLLSMFPLLADHLDGLQLLDSLLGDANLWED